MKRALFFVLLFACKRTPEPPETPASAYMGRPIAQPMSYAGADWLDRPDREGREQPEHVLDVLEIKPGMRVADVGAGTGYFTMRIAKRVVPNGSVLATDLQPEMLKMLREKSGPNPAIETVVTEPRDAKLPKNSLDLVLMVDVYHELPWPAETAAQIHDALKPSGRVALVEYRLEDPKIPIKTEHRMALPQIRKELEAAQFTFVKSDESLPEQRIVIFSR